MASSNDTPGTTFPLCIADRVSRMNKKKQCENERAPRARLHTASSLPFHNVSSRHARPSKQAVVLPHHPPPIESPRCAKLVWV